MSDAISASGLRITLSTPAMADLDVLRSWFADTWLEMLGSGARADVDSVPPLDTWVERGTDGSVPRFVLLNGTPIGFVRFRGETDRLVIVELAVAARERNRGYGAEAVYAIEQENAGQESAFARIPAGNGLAVYFWLRIGYRPLFAGEHGDHSVAVVTRRLRDRSDVNGSGGV